MVLEICERADVYLNTLLPSGSGVTITSIFIGYFAPSLPDLISRIEFVHVVKACDILVRRKWQNAAVMRVSLKQEPKSDMPRMEVWFLGRGSGDRYELLPVQSGALSAF